MAAPGVPIALRGAVAWASRRRPLRAVLLHPAVARPGYWLASACGALWGGLLGGFRYRRRGGVVVCAGLPRWAFGRGGTTIGAVYLTRDTVSDAVLRHEAVHRAQWRRYGLVFPVLYFAAGVDPHTNRFEVEAGLREGGYR
ncbi:hypothetical protein CLV46_2334 [Diaminobutyricimonas aerilata]|uniref:Fe-S oxidoreductase n=1 Tax=Diaminobutyricimonas aerilata TaxID=1162967 RepID=A0A2M9CLK0_9MICO|nr:hypothetical protein [Diaminobutyricimonas aerilata]PJJ72758.1 hypothetical protein CLV46_2334 [Diaminobutyricimonas aerilata]